MNWSYAIKNEVFHLMLSLLPPWQIGVSVLVIEIGCSTRLIRSAYFVKRSKNYFSLTNRPIDIYNTDYLFYYQAQEILFIGCGKKVIVADYISLEDAAQMSGLHRNTIRRLLRVGKIIGYKRAGWFWMVSARSLKTYTDPISGFLLEQPGPKLFLKRREDKDL